MRISDWSSDVCSSDLHFNRAAGEPEGHPPERTGARPLKQLFGRGDEETLVADLGVEIVEKARIGACPRGHRHGAGRQDGRLAHSQSNAPFRSEEHTSELQSLMRTSYADFCLNKKNSQYN